MAGPAIPVARFLMLAAGWLVCCGAETAKWLPASRRGESRWCSTKPWACRCINGLLSPAADRGRMPSTRGEFTLLQYRQPTPAQSSEPPAYAATPDDGGWYAPPVSQDAGKNGGSLLPGREKMAEEFNVKIDRLEQQLSELTRAIQQSQGRPDASTQAALADAQRQLAELQAAKAAAEAKETAKPKESAIDEKIDAVLHKLPVQGPIAKHLEGDIEKGGIHAIFGDAGAIVFLTLLAVIPLLGIILVGHAIYQKCHADAAGITARLSAVPGVARASPLDSMRSISSTRTTSSR